MGDIYVCSNDPKHVFALTQKESEGIKQEMMKKCSEKTHIVEREDENARLVVSFQNMVIPRTKHKGNGKRHPCIFCCNHSSAKTQFDNVLSTTTVEEEEKKQSERLRKTIAPKKKKKKPVLGLKQKANNSYHASPCMCYFPVCVYPACKTRKLSHTPEQTKYTNAYKFLYNHMLKSNNDNLKNARDEIKDNAKLLLPLSIPIVEDIVALLNCPRINPKTLREKLQDLSRAIGVFNNTHRYFDGRIVPNINGPKVSNQETLDAISTTSETTLSMHSETHSETHSMHSETTHLETSPSTHSMHSETSSPSTPLDTIPWGNETHNTWAKKLIDTTKRPFEKTLGKPPGFEDDTILPVQSANENLMVFSNSMLSPNKSIDSTDSTTSRERLERTNAFLKNTLQTFKDNAVKWEQKSNEWERLFFDTKQENHRLAAENQRLVSVNHALTQEVEAGKKKLGAIQDFFLSIF